MLGIGSRIFSRPDDIDIAQRLTEGCIWAYNSTATGVMPESFAAIPCRDDCVWTPAKWHAGISLAGEEDVKAMIEEQHLPRGFSNVVDRRYLLRPEAIESVFIMWRLTGNEYFQDAAWKMFESVIKVTKTDIAHSAINDVTVADTGKMDNMESFWLAETLKYYYLVFDEVDHISLDDWVFNTEAHPFRRPR
jgi:mannosyl-oligosaccharide alpha-1,2-mannosidase